MAHADDLHWTMLARIVLGSTAAVHVVSILHACICLCLGWPFTVAGVCCQTHNFSTTRAEMVLCGGAEDAIRAISVQAIPHQYRNRGIHWSGSYT